jgi:hypothetical protein
MRYRKIRTATATHEDAERDIKEREVQHFTAESPSTNAAPKSEIVYTAE